MDTGVNENVILQKLSFIENKLSDIFKKIEPVTIPPNPLGDWIVESEAKKITGLSRSTLLKMRRDGLISSSTISGKQNYYRITDFEKLLTKNEQNR